MQRIQAVPETLAAKTRRGLLDFQRNTLGFDDPRARSNTQAVMNMLDFLPFYSSPANVSEGARQAAQGNVLGSLGYNAMGVLDALDGPIPTAMFLGGLAKNAPKQVMRKAEDLYDQGMKPKDVWEQIAREDGQSVMVNRAGETKFEISDAQSELTPDIFGRMINNIGDQTVPITDVFRHDELFGQYPQLREVKFRTEPSDSRFRGSFDRETNTITTKVEDEYGNKVDPDSLRGTLLHELQHGVQNIEDFSKGGNLSVGRSAYEQALSAGNRAELMAAKVNEAIKRAESADPVVQDLRKQIEESGFDIGQALRLEGELMDYRNSAPSLKPLYDQIEVINKAILDVGDTASLSRHVIGGRDGRFGVVHPVTGEHEVFDNRYDAVDRAFQLHAGRDGYANLAGEVEARLATDRADIQGVANVNPFESRQYAKYPESRHLYLNRQDELMPAAHSFMDETVFRNLPSEVVSIMNQLGVRN